MKINSLVMLLAVSVIPVALTSSCGSKVQKKQTVQLASADTAMDVDQVLSNADTWINQPVRMEGVCTHICAHGGGKIFMMGSDDTRTIRVEAGEKIGSFKPETVNSLVLVSGTLREERVDESFLSQWEAQVGSQSQEKHGAEGESGCSADQQSRGEETVNSETERIANFRRRIAERKASEGKDYLSFYYVEADRYEIL